LGRGKGKGKKGKRRGEGEMIGGGLLGERIVKRSLDDLIEIGEGPLLGGGGAAGGGEGGEGGMKTVFVKFEDPVFEVVFGFKAEEAHSEFVSITLE
jgi:hypothetical protein